MIRRQQARLRVASVLVAISLGIFALLVMKVSHASAGIASTQSCTTPAKIAPPAGQTTYFNEFSGLDSNASPTRQDIRAEMVDLINSADAGSHIYIGAFMLMSSEIIDALENAADPACRGVVVQVLIDHNYVTDPAAASFRDWINTNGATGSWVEACPNQACIAHDNAASINHTKFMLLSSVDGATDLVFQSSANFRDDNSGDQYWNNAVLVNDGSYGSTVLYDSYLQYFQDMYYYGYSPGAGIPSPWDYWPYQPAASRLDNSASAKTYYSPDKTNDIIDVDLNNITCVDGSTTTQIRVAEDLWSDGRIAVANTLHSLALAGCKVRIIFRGDAGSQVQSLFTQNYNDFTELNYFCPPYTQSSAYATTDYYDMHDKYILINGDYNGTVQKIVLTGSQNLNNKSLKYNDDVALKLIDSATYDAYKADFTNMQTMLESENRTLTGQTAPLCGPK